jgi:hypothetical protein
MKKVILIVLALITIQVSAQDRKQEFRKGERKERVNKFEDFSAEEIAELQTKRMTLDLDLTSSQQKQIQKLNLENATERKAKMEERQSKMMEKGEKPSKEGRLKMMNERLDKQIEMKEKMKKILNEKQFEKWEKINKRNQFQKSDKNKERKMRRS